MRAVCLLHFVQVSGPSHVSIRLVRLQATYSYDAHPADILYTHTHAHTRTHTTGMSYPTKAARTRTTMVPSILLATGFHCCKLLKVRECPSLGESQSISCLENI